MVHRLSCLRLFIVVVSISLLAFNETQARPQQTGANSATLNSIGDQGSYFGTHYGGQTFFVQVDLAFLQRSGPSSSGSLVFDNTFTTTYLSTSDIQLGTPSVPIVRIGIGDPMGSAMELEFWNTVHHFESVQNQTNVTPTFFNAIPATPVGSYNFIVSANIDNIELNKWQRVSERLRVGCGVRYVNMREIFDVVQSDSSGGRIGFFSRTENRMIGPQLLGDITIASNERFRLFGLVKGGLFFNDVDIDAIVQNAQIRPNEETFSFLAELKAGLEIALTRWTSVRVGYQATMLNRVAQSIDQSSALNVFVSI